MFGPTDLINGHNRETLDEDSLFRLAIRFLCIADPDIWFKRKLRYLEGSMDRNYAGINSYEIFQQVIDDLVKDDFAHIKSLEEVTINKIDQQLCAYEDILITGEKGSYDEEVAKSKIFRRLDFLLSELEEHDKETCHREIMIKAIRIGISLDTIPKSWKTVNHISRSEYWRRNPKALQWTTYR